MFPLFRFPSASFSSKAPKELEASEIASTFILVSGCTLTWIQAYDEFRHLHSMDNTLVDVHTETVFGGLLESFFGGVM